MEEQTIMKQKRIQILNTTIDVLDKKQTLIETERYLQEKRPLHLMGVNADKINMLNKNATLKKIVNGCGIINADGASVILASRYLGTPLPERVAGIDLMLDLASLAEKKKYSIFLLGARQEIVEKTADELHRRFPALIISGLRNGYFSRNDWDAVAEQIRASRAQIVFVGISSPLKEYLVEYFMNDKNINCVFMGVGGSFDVISGAVKRAPVWMQEHNLEWFFRFLQEPVRLFHRYFIGNWVFVFSVWQEKRKRKKKNESINGWRR